MKYRDKLSRPMAGLIPFGGGVIARRITKVGEHSNPVIRSFIIFLRRGSYKEAADNPQPLFLSGHSKYRRLDQEVFFSRKKRYQSASKKTARSFRCGDGGGRT